MGLSCGLISRHDYLGNRHADIFAGKAADACQVPDKIVDAFATIDGRAWKIQTRLVEVLIACRTRKLDLEAADFWRKQKEMRKMLLPKIEACPPSFMRQQNVCVAVEDLRVEGSRILGDSIAAGGARSSCFHPSHRMVCTRGLYWCARCGSYATKRGRKLHKKCINPTRDGLA